MTLAEPFVGSRLNFFNVGHGDSVLLETDDRKVIIIDCALGHTSADCEPAAVRYLEQRGIHDVQLLVITHPDQDHWGGVPKLVDWIKEKGGTIHNVVLYPGPTPVELASRFGERLKQQHTNAKNAADQHRLLRQLGAGYGGVEKLWQHLLGIKRDVDKRCGIFRRGGPFGHIQTIGDKDGTHVFILGPTSPDMHKWENSVVDNILDALIFMRPLNKKSMNAISCIIWIWIGDVAILIGGDSTKETWARAITVYENNHQVFFTRDTCAQIVLASHHGSKSGSSGIVWDKITSKDDSIVVFSARSRPGWDLPSETTLSHIEACGKPVKVFCTNICPARLYSLCSTVSVQPALPEMLSVDRGWPPSHKDRMPVFDGSPGTPCHGNLVFLIDAKGTITPLPEFDRGSCWYLNKKKETPGVCFSALAGTKGNP